MALRTIGDGVSITFGEYAERVGGSPAGCTRSASGAATRSGSCSPTGPSSTCSTRPRCTSARRRSRSTTPRSAEQIAYLLADAGNRVLIVEAAFLDRRPSGDRADRHGRAPGRPRRRARGRDHARGARGRAARATEFDFEASWRAVEPRRRADADLHLGHDRPAEGRAADPRQRARRVPRDRRRRPCPDPDGSVVSYLPHAHIADRGLSHYAQMVWGHTVTCCPDVTQVFAHVADCRPTVLGRRPADLGEAEGRARGGDRSRARRTRSAPARWRRSSSGCARCGPSRPGSRFPPALAEACERAERSVYSKIRAKLGLDRCEWYMIGAAPCPLEVLEFFAAIGIPICEVWGMSETDLDRDAACRASGCKLGTVGTADPRRRDAARRRRRGARPRRHGDGRLPQPAREDGRDDRRRRLAAHRRHRRRSTRTAT